MLEVCVSFRIDGKPEDVLNPKKKQLDKITPVCASYFLIGYFDMSALLYIGWYMRCISFHFKFV